MIVVIGLAAGLGVEKSKSNERITAITAPIGDCTTPMCIDLSNQILSSLDESIDPCDDFYAFACNGFIEEAIIPFGIILCTCSLLQVDSVIRVCYCTLYIPITKPYQSTSLGNTALIALGQYEN